MLFSSNVFLFMFLPCTLVIYYLLGKQYRNMFLFLASLLFYAWGEPKFVLVMLGTILINYVFALLIVRFRAKKRLSKAFLVASVVVNLGMLFVFKYLDFAIGNLNAFGLSIPPRGIALPIGISFFTFQTMSYVIDVYRGDAAVQTKPQNIGLYVAFFPQLIAGPIVRYQTIADQIDGRTHSLAEFSEGVRRFIIGFAKKIILANSMAIIADHAFALPDAERSVAYAWIGALAYAFQILFDFSGYSEMAIGLGKMFGFRFLENFDYPYIAKSVSEFWRRWHMSLGQWFRDYVYFPLGGSRVKTRGRLVFNLFVVWFLTGVWHGASWNFIAWGLIYFVLIVFEKLSGYPQKFRSAAAQTLYRIFTLLCVLLGWVMFRAEGARAAIGYGLSMLGLRGNALTDGNAVAALRDYWFFMLGAVLCSTTVFAWLRAHVDARASKRLRSVANAASVAVYMFLLVWAVSFVILGTHNPFIYFNF